MNEYLIVNVVVPIINGGETDLAVDASYRKFIEQFLLELVSPLLLLNEFFRSLSSEIVCLLYSPLDVTLDVVNQVFIHCLVHLNLEINVV